jgi:RNA polymerase sigma-70 factor (ECF subfamily)
MRPEVEQALSALKSGEIEQGLQLLERTVLSFGMKVCGHREDAEDTAQEVLLKLLPYVSKFDSPRAFSVWLYTVARNRCLMSRRRSKFAPKEELTLDELMPSDQELAALAGDQQSTPERSLLRKENSERIREALERIPVQYRLILVLHDMEGLDTAEVAKVVALREGTVRVRLHRGRLALRRELVATDHVAISRKSPTAKKPRSCREIFAALSDYLDKTIDPAFCESLEKHMAGCNPCEAFLADLERTIQMCRSYNPSCDSAAKTKLRTRVLAEYSRVLSSLPQKKRSSH